MSHADDSFQPGSVVAGKYRVQQVIGRGGMGLVLAAEHLQLGQRVALKTMVPELCANREAVERFLREARAAVRIQSEHVARVTDVGTLDNGAPYMVMELLEGANLDEHLEARGPLPVAEAVTFLLQACVALAEAHTLGIVHRDLKPANLFLARRRDGVAVIKILDFGISKALDQAPGAMSLTATSAVMGSPLYMSPEQIRNVKDVDARTDIWALGAILYELLAGAPAFDADSATAVLARVVSDEPAPLTTYRSDLPAGLDRVLQRCLSKDRGARYPNVALLAHALAPFAPGTTTLVARISTLLGTHAEATRASAPFEMQSEASSSEGVVASVKARSLLGPKQRGPLWIVAAAVALGVSGYFWLHSDRAPSASAEPLVTEPSPVTAPPAPQALGAQTVNPSVNPAPESERSPVSSAPDAPSTRATTVPARNKQSAGTRRAARPAKSRGEDLFADPK